jgi:anti-anti-sigma factor
MVRNINPELRTLTVIAPQSISQRTLGGLDRLIDDAITQKPDIIDVAMAAVQGVDSTGLGWLISVQERLGGLGIKLRLTDASDLVQDILLATRLETRFSLHCTSGVPSHA